jgi:hypothetical protein
MILRIFIFYLETEKYKGRNNKTIKTYNR